jgi:ribosomal RNA assembly protein
MNIPKDRVGVLIGPRGATKKRLEAETGAKLLVDSESGEVQIDRGAAKDQLAALKSLDIIKAIGRGFAPQKAFKLLNDNIYLEIIDLTELVGDSPRSLARVKARIIGEEGRARRYISRLTGTEIVVYGKTVCILGDAENASLAKETIYKIIEGLPHNAVFRFLERAHKRLD